MMPWSNVGTRAFILALAIVVPTFASADAETKIVPPGSPIDLESLWRCTQVFNATLKRFQERKIDERVFRNSLKKEGCWGFADIRSEYYDGVVADDNEKRIIDVLKKGSAECDLDARQRHMHGRGDEGILRALCGAALRLSRINMKKLDEIINATTNNCRDVFIVCKDMEKYQFTERELEELAKETKWRFVKFFVDIKLKKLRGIVDDSEAKRMRQLIEESEKAEERRRQSIQPGDGGKGPSGSPQENRGDAGGGKDGGVDGGGDGGRPQEHGMKKDEESGRRTVWMLAGAGVTVAVLALLAAKGLRRK